jgi:hypothetical protein
MYACLCMDGGMYGCPAGGRTTVCCLSISERYSAPYLHARMHVYNACVVRALRHVFVSGRPHQASGLRGGSPEPSPSLLFSSPSRATQTIHTVIWPLPASQPANIQYTVVRTPGFRAGCLSSHPARAGSAAPPTPTQQNTRNTHHAPHTYFTLYSTCRFRKLVASYRSLW